ncbi:hypothetical protein HZA33_03255 [Candidatus Pacearchaeota archaeon]|nr:hypothetical protein [Candidatus Pacearchaeota archaeon]
MKTRNLALILALPVAFSTLSCKPEKKQYQGDVLPAGNIAMYTQSDQNTKKMDRIIAKLDQLNEKIQAKHAAITVKGYLSAIYRDDYKTAYEMLSSESRKQHSYDDFVNANKKGITDYDIKSRKVKKARNEWNVSLNLAEDPASWSFSVKEEKAKDKKGNNIKEMKIIWHSGLPTFPYK